MGAIFHCGTNDYSEGATQEEIIERALDIIHFMQDTSPETRLAFGLILPRPQDSDLDPEAGIIKERERKKLNSAMKYMCRNQGVMFANCITAVKTDKQFDIELYAGDHLHLDNQAIANLGKYYQGIAGAQMQRDLP
jgi:lysophospholipase L1-like esterase